MITPRTLKKLKKKKLSVDPDLQFYPDLDPKHWCEGGNTFVVKFIFYQGSTGVQRGREIPDGSSDQMG